jgi:MerR family mercuric resistance operon transcriptional regulator
MTQHKTDNSPQFTIGKLAAAAGVGVETIRYYQRRGLLPVPDNAQGFRHYPATLADRIRFIRRAQELGFSLDEVGHLLQLEQGGERLAIRSLAAERLAQVQAKIHDLQKMESMLSGLIQACAHSSGDTACPIIAALAGELAVSAPDCPPERPDCPVSGCGH